MLKTFFMFFKLELILLLRRSHDWIYPLGFFCIIVAIFPLAFNPDITFLQKIIPGCIWIAALFSNLLSIDKIFYNDLEDGNLEQSLLSTVPLTGLVLAKLSAQWIVTQLPLILLTPLLTTLFALPTHETLALMVSLLLGTPILTLIGSLGVALTLGLKQQGMILAILILPLITPVLIFGVNIVQEAQASLSLHGPVMFLAGLCLITIAILPSAIAACLRLSMDD